jgi:ABC-2 type transport system ATP-binding protein
MASRLAATSEFRGLLERLQREGKTVLLCSHLLSEVERVADRVLILLDGAAAAVLRLEELRTRQIHDSRLIIESEDDLDAAVAALAAQGIHAGVRRGRGLAIEDASRRGSEAHELLRRLGVTIRTFEVERPSLEEIFLEVVHEGRRSASGARDTEIPVAAPAATPTWRVRAGSADAAATP